MKLKKERKCMKKKKKEFLQDYEIVVCKSSGVKRERVCDLKSEENGEKGK